MVTICDQLIEPVRSWHRIEFRHRSGLGEDSTSNSPQPFDWGSSRLDIGQPFQWFFAPAWIWQRRRIAKRLLRHPESADKAHLLELESTAWSEQERLHRMLT